MDVKDLIEAMTPEIYQRPYRRLSWANGRTAWR